MRTRCKQLNLRLTLEEKQHLTRAAARGGLTAAGFLRMLADGYRPKPTPPQEYHRLLQLLYALQPHLDERDPQAKGLLAQAILALQQLFTLPERM